MNNAESLRLVFAGTPEFAACHLQALLDANLQITAVYTQPDRPAGRGKQLAASPVKKLALAHSLSVFQPGSLRSPEAQDELARLNPDLLIVVAYGLILPQAVLTIPRHGCINVHASLLPRWRGAAPIQRAIEAGDSETGITIMQMDAGLDTGPMLYRATCAIDADTTGGSLHDRLARLGAPALLTVLEQIATGSNQAEAQDDNLSTYAAKISKAEACIDWNLPANVIERKIRAFNPFPITFSHYGDSSLRIHKAAIESNSGTAGNPGQILGVEPGGLSVACGTGVLTLTELQLPGKKPMVFAQLLRGHSGLFHIGAQFGPCRLER